MKKFVSLMLVLCALLIASCAENHIEYLQKHEQEQYFFRLTRFDGSPTNLEAYRGKKLMVVFWAQHCLRSRWLVKEISEKTKSGEIPAEVPIIAVNVDKFVNFEKVKKFLEDIDTNRIEVMFSGNDIDDEAYVACEGKAIPLTVMFDEDLRMKTRDLAGDGLKAAMRYLGSGSSSQSQPPSQSLPPPQS